MEQIKDFFEINPVIPAVAKEEDLLTARDAGADIVFVLYGDIVSLPRIVAILKEKVKFVIVATDLIEGLSSQRQVVPQFIQKVVKADGILSNRAQVLQFAKRMGLITIHRFFIVDSRSLYALDAQYKISQADAIDLMPGIALQTFRYVTPTTKTPIIASGMITNKAETIAAIDAGATSISSTNPTVWQV